MKTCPICKTIVKPSDDYEKAVGAIEDAVNALNNIDEDDCTAGVYDEITIAIETLEAVLEREK